MDLGNFYQEIGGSFQEVVGRFGGMEAMVKKFLGRFREDKSFQKLEDAVAQMDAKAIDDAAHTLKGVCSNLGITRLQQYAEELMLHVRQSKPMEEVPAMMEKIRDEYKLVIEKLNGMLDDK